MNYIKIQLIRLFPRLLFKNCSFLLEYQKKWKGDKKSLKIQQCIIENQKEIDISGYCFHCNKKVKMRVDFEYGFKSLDGKIIPNFRERLTCEFCGLNSRMRATLQAISYLCGDLKNKKVYITEELTPLYDLLQKKCKFIKGSEFVPEKELGKRIKIDGVNKEINNQDLTRLTFKDKEFDLVISLDCLEHIFQYKKALSEIFRVLNRNGTFVFSVPFCLESEKNIERAKIKNGAIVNLLPPEYHGDPVTQKGCLCFYHFGWEILENLKKIGYKESSALLYQSSNFGYLSQGIIFYAKK